MFDVGFWELALISIVALIIIGPERLPEAARTVGLWVGKGRRMLREVKADIDRELREHEVTDLSALKKDIESAGAQFKSATEKVSESVGAKDMAESLKQTFEEASPLGKGKPGTESKGEPSADKLDGAKPGPAKKATRKKPTGAKKPAQKTGKKTTAKKTTTRKTATKKVAKKKIAKKSAQKTKTRRGGSESTRKNQRA